MAWLLRIGLAYVGVMLLAIGLMQYLARVEHVRQFVLIDPTQRYFLAVYRDLKLPLGLGGFEPAPGEAEVRDRAGRLIDSERVSDVYAITKTVWEPYHVDLYYVRAGRTYRLTLDLAQ